LLLLLEWIQDLLGLLLLLLLLWQLDVGWTHIKRSTDRVIGLSVCEFWVLESEVFKRLSRHVDDWERLLRLSKLRVSRLL
jgi:hypothetical protein